MVVVDIMDVVVDITLHVVVDAIEDIVVQIVVKDLVMVVGSELSLPNSVYLAHDLFEERLTVYKISFS